MKHSNSARVSFAFFAFLFLIAPVYATAQNWTQWLGPERNGKIPRLATPAVFPENLELLWDKKVGRGYSSPLIYDNRAYIHTRVDEMEVVTCLDLKTGETIWRRENEAPMERNQYAVKHGKGPFATPTIYAGKLFTVGVTGVLTCFDLEQGNVLWRDVYKKDGLNTEKFFCGNTSSPLIHKNMCITFIGDDDAGELTARDLDSGKQIWTWNGDNPGYASPFLIESKGVEQIVTLTQSKVIGVTAKNGELLWSISFASEWKENISTPVFYDDMIIYSGVGRGTLAVKLVKSGNRWETGAVWENKEISMYMNSPVLFDGALYGLSQKQRGQFFCLDAKTGATLWTSEGRQGLNASLLYADRRFLSVTTEAELVVFKADSQEFARIHKSSLADTPVWALPAVSKNFVLIKSQDALRLFAFPSAEDAGL